MDEKTNIHYQVHEPPRWLYGLLRVLIVAYVKLFFGLRVTTRQALPKKGALLIVCSHPGMMDFLFTAAAVNERPLHFIGADYYFQHKLLGPVLRRLGVIPKMQFYPDMRSVAATLQVLKAGGAVAVFPAGQTSLDGTSMAIAPSITRLIHKAGAPLAALRIHGGFFAYSRFGRGAVNRGRVEVEKALVLTPQQIAEMDDGSLFSTVVSAIAFDDFAWQRQTGQRLRGSKRAQGYENMLVRCPKCAARYSYEAAGNRLWCAECGNAGAVGADMRLAPEGGSVMPADLQAWLRWQSESILAEAEKAGFKMQTPVRLSRYGHFDDGYIGSGVARMDSDALHYEGTCDGQPVSFSVKHAILPGLTGEFGDYFYIPHGDYGALCCHPQQGKSVIEWKVVQEYLHARAAG